MTKRRTMANDAREVISALLSRYEQSGNTCFSEKQDTDECVNKTFDECSVCKHHLYMKKVQQRFAP
jgi:hypothetical protein